MKGLNPGLVGPMSNYFMKGGTKVWCGERQTFVIVPVVDVEDTPSEMGTSHVTPATESVVSYYRTGDWWCEERQGYIDSGTCHHDQCHGGHPADTPTVLPSKPEERKAVPIATGFVDYFPDAMAAVAELSAKATAQHHPGEPLHWDRAKSSDEADALMRHFLERGTLDTDGVPHTTKVAWRAMALLQKELEDARTD